MKKRKMAKYHLGTYQRKTVYVITIIKKNNQIYKLVIMNPETFETKTVLASLVEPGGIGADVLTFSF